MYSDRFGKAEIYKPLYELLPINVSDRLESKNKSLFINTSCLVALVADKGFI
jgi:hypothetical protein